ncbi:MAG: Nif3-like dinuclear metal center hexameric protein [Patescibacteria group bacterium]|nr:Nif3-like dinuclear metal center hexameric protein [Patescibacteria group bacterium]
MIKRDELVNFLNNYFEPYQKLADENEMIANGLQIPGAEEVTKVALGVSANLEFFEKSVEQGGNFLIVHHGFGLNRGFDKNLMSRIMAERLRFLFKNDLSLCGYHFLLDHHPEIGNNAPVLRELGAEIQGNIHGSWGYWGNLSVERPLEDVVDFLEKYYRHPGYVLYPNDRKISRVAVVSGSGGPDFNLAEEFREKAIDLLVTGDVRESHFAVAREINLTVAAFGHYNTETIGVKNLGEVIKKQFPQLPVEFVDVPNEL